MVGFSTIDEAWGLVPGVRSDEKRNSKKGRKKSQPCHLYEVDPVDDYEKYEKYVKAPNSRTQLPLPMTKQEKKRVPNLEVDVYPDVDWFDAKASPMDTFSNEVEDENIENKEEDKIEKDIVSLEEDISERIEKFVEERLKATGSKLIKRNAHLEFAAFISVGLLLILILEQLISVGMRMRSPF
jgi:hypothetical protein